MSNQGNEGTQPLDSVVETVRATLYAINDGASPDEIDQGFGDAFVTLAKHLGPDKAVECIDQLMIDLPEAGASAQ